jgi:hypothetical protein
MGENRNTTRLRKRLRRWGIDKMTVSGDENSFRNSGFFPSGVMIIRRACFFSVGNTSDRRKFLADMPKGMDMTIVFMTPHNIKMLDS